MGPLALPSNGPVYVDASDFNYSGERIEPYQVLLESVWQQAQAGQFSVASSELVVLETLVRPLRDGNAVVETLFRLLFETNEVRLIAATRSLWEEAARLRGRHGPEDA